MTDFEFVKAYMKELLRLEKIWNKSAESYPKNHIKHRIFNHLSGLVVTEQETVMDDLESEHRDKISEFIQEWRDKH